MNLCTALDIFDATIRGMVAVIALHPEQQFAILRMLTVDIAKGRLATKPFSRADAIDLVLTYKPVRPVAHSPA